MINTRFWKRGDTVDAYATRELRPVESVLMVRFAEHLRGRVLELGCGAGRITGYLAAAADRVDALDVSPQMLAACGSRYPGVHLREGDVGDLSGFADESYTAVVAGYNLLDVFADGERRRVLREIRRVLAPGGILIMSSHHRAALPMVRRPWQLRPVAPRRGLRAGLLGPAADLVRLPRRLIRHLRLRRLESATADYAVVSDGSHGFSLVHYFTSWPAQMRQFEEEGLQPLLAADLDGRELSADYEAAECPEIHYAARRPPLKP